MREQPRIAVAIAALAVLAGCVQNDDNRLELYVDALISDEGTLADQAERALVARGRSVVVIVETGLYRADPRGRKRLVQVLDQIHSADVVPVLRHVAAYDADDDVSRAARAALERRKLKVPPRAVADAGAAPAGTSCGSELAWRGIAAGIEFAEVLPGRAPTLPGGDPCLAIVRIDPQKVSPEIHTALPDRGYSAEEWLREAKLAVVINAGLYLRSGVPTGLTIADGKEINGAENRSYSGFLAFGPRREGIDVAVITGRDCPGFDLKGLKRDYKNVIQAARLLDCKGAALPWADARPHSAVAIGLDESGRFVLVHAQALYRMADLAMLIGGALPLRGALFVEGGSEAQLAVGIDEFHWSRSGGYGFALGLGQGGAAEKIPNIIGFAAR